MTRNVVSRGVKDLFEIQSFRVGTTAIEMGKPVKINSNGRVDISGNYTNGDLTIGVIDHMNDYVAENGTTTVAAGDPAQVLMDGFTEILETGGTYNAGVFVKLDANGKLIEEDTGSTRTVNSIGISLEASTASGQEKKVLRK